MITTALAVGSDGAINLGDGPTFGILLIILFLHGIVCSAATSVIARLNLFYVIVNGMQPLFYPFIFLILAFLTSWHHYCSHNQLACGFWR